MLISDWSADVCSSDLLDPAGAAAGERNVDRPRARIDRVFDKFLQCAGRTLHHLVRGDAVYQVLRQTTNGHDTALADQVAASPMENHWTQRAQAAIVRAGRGPTERGESAPGARTQVHMPEIGRATCRARVCRDG